MEKNYNSRNWMFWEGDSLGGKVLGVIVKVKEEDKEILDKINVTFVPIDFKEARK